MLFSEVLYYNLKAKSIGLKTSFYCSNGSNYSVECNTIEISTQVHWPQLSFFKHSINTFHIYPSGPVTVVEYSHVASTKCLVSCRDIFNVHDDSKIG